MHLILEIPLKLYHKTNFYLYTFFPYLILLRAYSRLSDDNDKTQVDVCKANTLLLVLSISPALK